MKKLALGFLILTPVFAQKIEIEFDQAVDFSKFSSFSIGEAQVKSKDPSLNHDQVRRRLNLEIQKSLEAKGLTFVSKGASLNVVYILKSATKSKVQASPQLRGNAPILATVPYTEGKLVLGLRTAQSLVWRAIAVVETQNLAGRLDDLVGKAIEQYPPKH